MGIRYTLRKIEMGKSIIIQTNPIWGFLVVAGLLGATSWIAPAATLTLHNWSVETKKSLGTPQQR